MVVAEGLDRISRNLKDIAAIHETLSYHGVTIWTAHEGQISELHIGLKGTMNALFLRDMKEKVRRGLSARVAAGYAASSCAYGYRVVRGIVDARGRNVNGVREIDEAEAAVIRRIYQEYADGKRTGEIIAGLNAENIPAPGGGIWRKPALLGSSRKREGILRTEIYLGKLVFNKTRVVREPVTNKKRFVLLPEDQWTRVDVPHLRIVSDELWEAVRTRDKPQPRTKDERLPPPKKEGKPRSVSHNQHALTGWVKCGWCGGTKNLANNSRYLCSTHRYARQCKNARGTKEEPLLRAVFEELRVRIRTGTAFRPTFTKVYADDDREITRLSKEGENIDKRIDRLMDAVENGIDGERATKRIIALKGELGAITARINLLRHPELPDEGTIRKRLMETIIAIQLDGDILLQRKAFGHLLEAIVLTPIDGQRSGETMKIALREEGWPGFWRMIGG